MRRRQYANKANGHDLSELAGHQKCSYMYRIQIILYNGENTMEDSSWVKVFTQMRDSSFE